MPVIDLEPSLCCTWLKSPCGYPADVESCQTDSDFTYQFEDPEPFSPNPYCFRNDRQLIESVTIVNDVAQSKHLRGLCPETSFPPSFRSMKQRIPIGSGVPPPLHTSQIRGPRPAPRPTPPAQTATSTNNVFKNANPLPTARLPYVRGASRIPTARPISKEQTVRPPEHNSLNSNAIRREGTLPGTSFGPIPWIVPPTPPAPPSSRPSRSSMGPVSQPVDVPPRSPVYDDALTDLDSFEVFPREAPRRPVHAYLSTHTRQNRLGPALSTDDNEDTATLSRAHSNIGRTTRASQRRNLTETLPNLCQFLFAFERPNPLIFALLILLGLSFFMLILLVGLHRSDGETPNFLSSTTDLTVPPISHAYLGQRSHSTLSQALWVNHVVAGNGQLLIPETFESRLNAEVAPVLQSHASKIWDPELASPLRCTSGERQIVAFFLEKSGAIPGSISVLQPCSDSPHARLCQNKRHVSDLRDLRITLPTHSSRYTYSVQIVEDRDMRPLSTEDFARSRRVKPLGVVSGPFQVELSDASRLALQRYCGRDRRNYPSDLRTEPVTMSNTRLLPLFELKRLFDLLSMSQKKFGQNWDYLQLSRATINPLDHSPHSITLSHLFHLFDNGMHTRSGDVYHPDILGRYRGIFDTADTEHNFESQSTEREDGFGRERFQYGRFRSDEVDEGRHDSERYSRSFTIPGSSTSSSFQDHSVYRSSEDRPFDHSGQKQREQRLLDFHKSENERGKYDREYNSNSDRQSREADNVSKTEVRRNETSENFGGGGLGTEAHRSSVERRSSDSEDQTKRGDYEDKESSSNSRPQVESLERNVVGEQAKDRQSGAVVAETSEMTSSNSTDATETLAANTLSDRKFITEDNRHLPVKSLSNVTSNSLLDGPFSPSPGLPRGTGFNETSSLPGSIGRMSSQSNKDAREAPKQAVEANEKSIMVYGPPQGPLYRRRYWTPPMGMLPGAPGMLPGAPGMLPGAPGMLPGAPGMLPGAPGMLPGAPGILPGAPGMPSHHMMSQRRGMGMGYRSTAPSIPGPLPFDQHPGTSMMHSSLPPGISGSQPIDHLSGLPGAHSSVWPNTLHPQLIRQRSEIPTAHHRTSGLSTSQGMNNLRGTPDMHTASEMSDSSRRSNVMGPYEGRMRGVSELTSSSQSVLPFRTTSGAWPTKMKWSSKAMPQQKVTWPPETDWSHSRWSSAMTAPTGNKYRSDFTDSSISETGKLQSVYKTPRLSESMRYRTSYLPGGKRSGGPEHLQDLENSKFWHSKFDGSGDSGSVGRLKSPRLSNGQYNPDEMQEFRDQTAQSGSVEDRAYSLATKRNLNNERAGWFDPERHYRKHPWNEMHFEESMNSMRSNRQQLPNGQSMPGSVRIGVDTPPMYGDALSLTQQGNEGGPFIDHYQANGAPETTHPTMTYDNGRMSGYH